MDLWSGEVRVPLAVKNRNTSSEITTVTITTIRKTITIQRVVRVLLQEKGLKSLFSFFFFFFVVNISMGQSEGWI